MVPERSSSTMACESNHKEAMMTTLTANPPAGTLAARRFARIRDQEQRDGRW
jgi:hypothetical protein